MSTEYSRGVTRDRVGGNDGTAETRSGRQVARTAAPAVRRQDRLRGIRRRLHPDKPP